MIFDYSLVIEDDKIYIPISPRTPRDLVYVVEAHLRFFVLKKNILSRIKFSLSLQIFSGSTCHKNVVWISFIVDFLKIFDDG